MATLDDINLSQQSGRQREQIKQPLKPSVKLEADTKEGDREYYVFKLVKRKRGTVYVDGICDNVLNPVTNRRERIWLLNGADSIWQSDLIELLKDKEYVKRNRRSLLFDDGILRIRKDDERALEFARATKHNVKDKKSGSGKFDFFEYDAAAEQKERLKKELKEVDMIIKAKEMKADAMKKLAAFFGIRFTDEIGMPIGDDGIRTELILKAKHDPYTFEKYLDSDEVNVSYLVKRAILDAKVDIDNNSARWADGKGFIAKIPADRKHYEYLTELAMTNSEEGKKFKEQLQTVVTT